MAEEKEWVSPLDVTYPELKELLGKKTISEYVGNKLPKEEVERIENDYKIYLNK